MGDGKGFEALVERKLWESWDIEAYATSEEAHHPLHYTGILGRTIDVADIPCQTSHSRALV
jgi:hypothetical protein